MISKVIYGMLLTVIGVVSVYDAYLNMKYPIEVPFEENPIACLILAKTDLPTLIALKFGGTLTVISTLICIYKTKCAFPVAIILAILQTIVMSYMLW